MLAILRTSSQRRNDKAIVVIFDPKLFVLDTNVLSEFARKRPNPQIANWLQNTKAGIAIPFGAVIELERGICNIASEHPEKSRSLGDWLQSLIESDILYLGMDAATARLYARMTCTPELKHLWVQSNTAKKPKLGQDLSVAAVAIIHAAAIATMNTKDFLAVHAFFPLPGLFDPMHDRWLVEPRQIREPPRRPAVDATSPS